MRIVQIIAAIGFPTVGAVMAVAYWQSLTQRRGAAAPKGRQMSVEYAGARRRQTDEEFDVVGIEVDTRSQKMRILGARKAARR